MVTICRKGRKAVLTKVPVVSNKGYWLKKLIIYIKNLKVLQNFYHLYKEFFKLLESSCHFDVPKICNLAFLLGIANSIEGQ